MPMIRRAAEMLRPAYAATVESPTVPLTSTSILDLLGGPATIAGVRVTEKTALSLPAVWRAVTLLAGTLAGLPLHAYDEADDGGRTRQRGTPAADLLQDPHPDLTPFELWELTYGALLLSGNAYALKLRNERNRYRELWWVAPHRVKPGRAGRDGTKLYVLDGDTDNPLFDDTMLHIPGFGYDGVMGLSPIGAARTNLGLSIAAEEFGARLFGGGALASGILTTEQRLDNDQAQEIKDRWVEQGGTGLKSAHDIRVLGSGATYQRLTIPPEDAQFLGTRAFGVDDVGRWYGLPAHLLNAQDKQTSWGTGIEQQNIGLVQFTLSNWITRVEQRLTKHVIRPAAGYARYSVEGLLRGDSQQRAEFYTKMFNLGVFSTNDILQLEDRPGIGPDGDVRFRPLNMGRLDGADDTEQEGATSAP